MTSVMGLLFLDREHGSLSIKCILLFFLLKCIVSLDLEQIYSVDNICDNVECEPFTMTDCLNGRIKMKVGYNGCCDDCVTKTDNVQSVCQKTKNNRLKILKEKDEYADNLWIPACKNNGDYKLTQTKAKKTTCMNNDGTELFGQDISEMSQKMSCKCSQHMHNLKIEEKDSFMIKPEEHCTATGNYEKIQCIDNLCYCANIETGEVEGRIVHMDHIDKLSRNEKKKAYLKSCERELVRVRTLRYQFLLKGINVLGLETVDCDPDGSFSPTQCDSSRCSCTNEEGVEIRSYFTEDVFRYIQMACDCARDNEKAAMHAQYPALKCDKYGNYNLTQCVRHAKCFCLDKDGDVISKELNVKELDVTTQSFCNKLLEHLSVQEPEKITTITMYLTTSPEDDNEDYYSEEQKKMF